MTAKKPITDKAILLYYDYDFLFNMQTDEELGASIRLLMKHQSDKKPPLSPTGNIKIDNVYNYIMSRIIDYKNTRGFYSKKGKTGGNPLLSKDTTLNTTLKGTDNPTVKPKEEKKEYKTIKEKKKEYIYICEVLESILVEYHNREFNSSKWYNDIKLLIEKDKVGYDRVISCLDWYKNNIGGKYIPVIQSGSSLREKFTKLEDAIKRNPTTNNEYENPYFIGSDF